LPRRLALRASILCGLLVLSVASAQGEDAAPLDYAIVPVGFTNVRIADEFWAPRLETNRKVTIAYDFAKCEETGRIDNFAKAGGLMQGSFRGRYYDDSDVFKVIEGASYTLAMRPDPELEEYLDALIAKIAAAQEDDGYLYTARTLNPEKPPAGSGPKRWTNLRYSHELYNVGHLYEAATAHFQATGKRSLLNVALKNAEMVATTFGPQGLKDPPGHQEIEIGLVKLYRVTGEQRYLDLAQFFLDQRGRAEGRALYGEVAQDHAPVNEQAEAVGHAVRAAYMYSGMADVAALTRNDRYIEALDRIWRSVIERKLYLTGGIGAKAHGEAFGADYELPNATAYNETCAAIALALWSQRMFLLHGDAKYIDVFERVVYNGFLAGIALEGNRFFYPNPLAADGVLPFNQGAPGRKPWFDCACCPVNIVRFLPSLAGSVVATRQERVFVNLFVGSRAKVGTPTGTVELVQETDYPWDGKIKLTVLTDTPQRLVLCLRVPGWSAGRPVPSDLYRHLEPTTERPTFALNGEAVEPAQHQGYAEFDRNWRNGDVLEMTLPMPVRRVVADDRVEADRGRVALERGPLVYCVESVDHRGSVRDLVLHDDVALTSQWRPELLGGMVVLRGAATRLQRADDGSLTEVPAELTSVPYYAWNHRGEGAMAVWLPREASLAMPLSAATEASAAKVSASHVWPSDAVAALHDRTEPANSGDHDIPRFTWWDHRGSREWVQYDFAAHKPISEVEVYWFDDTGRGQCRTPASWQVVSRGPAGWVPVELVDASRYTTTPDRFNVVRFKEVVTDAVRLEVQLRENASAGILEWKVR
jgi:DUF1680 family protein